MGTFGLTLDVSSMGALGWGDGIEPVEIDFQVGLALGEMVRGSQYAIGLEQGVSYLYAEDEWRGHNILGWNAGVRGDFLKAVHTGGYVDTLGIYRNEFWGLRLAAGYKGEYYPNDSIEHGLYSAFMFQYAWQNRCPQEIVDKWNSPDQNRNLPYFPLSSHSSVTSVGPCTGRDNYDRYAPSGQILLMEPSDCNGPYICEDPHRYPFEPASSLIVGAGPYFAYFPNSERGEVGLTVFIGADPFII